MYSFFVKILLTDKGKKSVREKQGNKDASKANATISAHLLKSEKDLINSSSKLLTLIISARVGDVSWCVTTEIFIINYQKQIQLYEALVEISDNFSRVQKRTVSENVVDPILSLQSIKNQAEKLKA